jgi:flavin-binding protein dodecin
MLVIVGALVPTTSARGQDSPEEHAGYFDLDELEILDADLASVDVNLRGAMLRLVGTAVLNDEPGLSDLVSNLVSMRVLVAESADLDSDAISKSITRAAARLDELGWQRVVRVRDDSEQVHLYVREVEADVVGITVLVLESSDEVVLVNMAGLIDPAQLVAIGQAFDIPTLEEALEEPSGSADSAGDSAGEEPQ